MNKLHPNSSNYINSSINYLLGIWVEVVMTHAFLKWYTSERKENQQTKETIQYQNINKTYIYTICYEKYHLAQNMLKSSKKNNPHKIKMYTNIKTVWHNSYWESKALRKKLSETVITLQNIRHYVLLIHIIWLNPYNSHSRQAMALFTLYSPVKPMLRTVSTLPKITHLLKGDSETYMQTA